MTKPHFIENFHPAKSSAARCAFEFPPLVLISGEEPDTLLLYRTILEMWKYRVVENEKPDKLLETIEKIQPDLVLIDLTISFADEINILSQIRDKFSLVRLPVILLSGHAQPEHHRTAINSGADDYLLKPINFETLENSLNKILLQPEQ